MTPEVRLESLNAVHVDALYELTIKNRSYLKTWLSWLDDIQSTDDTAAYVESAVKEADEARFPSFALFFGGALCGVAGFNKVDRRHRSGSIGYWLGEDYVGRGIVTASVAQLLVLGFHEFDLHKIEIRCAEENLKSRAVAERLGFTYEATLRQCEWLYTKYVDHAVYSLLASEYEPTSDLRG